MDVEPLIGGLTALIVFIGLSTPIIVIGIVYYYKKRLEHKQILAAIEKGTPLSELRPPKPAGALWIRSLTFGIAMITIGLAYLIVGPGPRGPMLFGAVVFLAIGIAWFIRGLLYRKHQPKIQPLDKNNTSVKNSL
jgi:hypothetical protein